MARKEGRCFAWAAIVTTSASPTFCHVSVGAMPTGSFIAAARCS